MKIKNHLLVILIALLLASIVSGWTEIISEKFLRQGMALITGMSRPDRTNLIIDDKGIPLVDYGSVQGVTIGKQRNPVTVCQKAIEYYDNILSGDSSTVVKFEACANWLVDSAFQRDSTALLVYNFPWPLYDLPAPWVSAMAQAQAIQVMIRGHRLTGDDKYLNHARSLCSAFFIDVDSGGVTYFDDSVDGGWWYEEYPTPGGNRPMILNGMMYTLIGLHSYSRNSLDTTAATLFQLGLKSLIHYLPDYDRHGHSYYDHLGSPAGGNYHQIHIELLDSLSTLTGNTQLVYYRDRWQAYSESSFIQRLFVAPTKIAVATFVMHFVVLFLLGELVLLLLVRRLSPSHI